MAKWAEIKCPRCEELEAKLKTSEEIGRAFEEDAGQLRAKLEKAVEALNKLTDCVDDGCFCSEMQMATAMDLARATLAELNYDERSEKKGQGDE